MSETDMDLLRSEAASMPDDEILAQFERTSWQDDPVLYRVLAREIAERLAIRVEDDG